MNKVTVSLVVAALVSAMPAHAGTTYEQVMIPIQASHVPGAHGSIWQSHVAITNHSTTPVDVVGYARCIGVCEESPPVLPDSTIYPGQVTYLYVEPGRSDDITVQLRIQDVSRQSQTWGTSIPVVRERDVFTEGTLSLVDVPNTDELRSMLRIYGFDPPVLPLNETHHHQVLIRIFGVSPDAEISTEADVFLGEWLEPLAIDESNPAQPPLAQVPLWIEDQLQGHDRLRIEIERLNPELRFWAFVSVTNNETQHVTVIAP